MSRLHRFARRLTAIVAIGGLYVGVLVVGPLQPAGAVTVSTEADLRLAFANDSLVELAADITLTDCSGGGGAIERTIAAPVTIDGHGNTLTQTCTDNAVFQQGTGLLTVQNLTITGGHATGSGGAIFAQGDVAIVASALVDNQADGFGGGVASDGAVSVTDSTIDGNATGPTGGGAGIAGNAIVDITRSTISNNVGGGVLTAAPTGAVVTVVNSTITGNGAVQTGGGITTGGLARLVYSTIVDNDATVAFDNLFAQQSEAFGTVIAGVAGGAINCLTGTGQVSLGYNFSSDASCGFDQPTDQLDAGSPGLEALAANGGPTLTRLPGAGSPLLDVIPAASCQDDGAAGVTTDQRGVERPQGGSCDIGAVEVAVAAPPPAPPLPPVVVITPTFTG